MYYIYHIPDKKIGVTCDLYNRVTLQQGYSEDEYEVLDSSEDIEYISAKELYLQREYGYRVDLIPYKDLKSKPEQIKFNKMNINVTDQTTTFPVPVRKLKGRLMDNMGMKWKNKGIEYQLREAIKKSGMSRNQLSIKSGVDPAQLCYFVQGKRSLTLRSAEKVAEALGLELKPKKRK